MGAIKPGRVKSTHSDGRVTVLCGGEVLTFHVNDDDLEGFQRAQLEHNDVVVEFDANDKPLGVRLKL
jgi:hypothetical protein